MKPFAKKRFGQNFLIDPNILRKIIRTVAPKTDDIIVEIGSGKGALTDLLIESGAIIHAIEIDDDLIPELERKFSDKSNFHLHHADALKFDLSSIKPANQKIRIVGNVPYNITSPLLFKVFDNSGIIDDVYFMVQREIARRICALPNTKEYGILSVVTQFYGKPAIAFDVSPKVFRPIPDVYSSVVSLKLNPELTEREIQDRFLTTVKTAFGKRRKTLRNSLFDLLKNKHGECPVDLGRRAESLNIAEFIKLSLWIFDAKRE